MYNYAMIIGEIENIHRNIGDDKAPKITKIDVKVRRSFKNSDGKYDYDYISVIAKDYMWDVFEKTKLSKGDKAIFKGHLKSNDYTTLVFEVNQIMNYDALQTE